MLYFIDLPCIFSLQCIILCIFYTPTLFIFPFTSQSQNNEKGLSSEDELDFGVRHWLSVIFFYTRANWPNKIKSNEKFLMKTGIPWSPGGKSKLAIFQIHNKLKLWTTYWWFSNTADSIPPSVNHLPWTATCRPDDFLQAPLFYYLFMYLPWILYNGMEETRKKIEFSHNTFIIPLLTYLDLYILPFI